MRSRSAFKATTLLALTLFLAFVLSACARQAVKSDTAAPAASTAAAPATQTAAPAATPAAAKETPLAKKYDRVVFQKFDFDPQIEKDYPGAVAECEKSALEATKAKKISAEREAAGAKYPGALLVKTRVTNLRIVSGAARFWAGPWAGSSDMSLQLKLVDAATGAVVREKELSTNNNPWAAAWTWGGSDRSLPSDLGAMVAEYLAAIR
jgi:hypothetical protein